MSSADKWYGAFAVVACLFCAGGAAAQGLELAPGASAVPAVACSREAPCGVGEGHCERDTDCQQAPGRALYCSPLQGARFGLPESFGVCTEARCRPINPRVPDWSACSAACPCPAGWGDCDQDEDCRPGVGLTCHQDVGALAGMPDGVDLCLPGCPEPEPDTALPGLCSESCPCGPRLGECERDSECQAGLVCKSGAGAFTGAGESTSLCCPPFDDARPDWGFCAQCGCGIDEGDCDSDADCASGLYCGRNNGPRVGLPAGFDLCTNRRLPLTVRVTRNGTNGTVAMPDGALCTGSCTYDTREGYEVKLTARVSGRATVVWSGCARTAGDDCYVTADQARSVRASFTPECPRFESVCCQRASDGRCLFCGQSVRACSGRVSPTRAPEPR